MKRHGLLLSLTMLFNAAYAQPEIGRVFFSKQERAELDRLRSSSTPGEMTTASEPVTQEPLRVDGVVQRSNGSAVAWINGETWQEAGARGAGKRVPLTAPVQAGGRSVRLKVGQEIDTRTGKVQDLVSRGRDSDVPGNSRQGGRNEK